MRRTVLVAMALNICTYSGIASASEQLRSKSPVQIDPQSGYVMARVGWSDAKGATTTFVIYRIDPKTDRLRSRDKKSINPVAKPEDFAALIGGDRIYSFGNVPIAGGSAGVFVTSLTPGDWVLAGTASTCACMGSYRFTVRPGEVTDIGTIVTGLFDRYAPFPEFRGPKPSPDLFEKAFVAPEAMLAHPASETDVVPAALASLPRVRAEYIAARFDNAAGWLVSRLSGLPPMGHESADAAAALVDPRYPWGTADNRWPDVEDAPPAKRRPR